MTSLALPAQPAVPPQYRRYANLEERIKANVIEQAPPQAAFIDLQGNHSPCWAWQGKIVRKYGVITIRKPVYSPDGLFLGKKPRNVRVHRLSLHLFRGFPLDGFEIGMHLCSCKICCNPFHLDPGTNSENQLYYNRVEKHYAAPAVALEGAELDDPPREPGED